MLWFEGSPLNAQSVWSQEPGPDWPWPCPAAGPHRIFLRAASLAGQHGLDVSELDGQTPGGQTATADPLDRGWRWLDLGLRDLSGHDTLEFQARGRGAVVSGVLAVPEAEFRSAQAALDRLFPARSGSTVLAEAEACATAQAGVYAAATDIPLLAPLPGVTLETRALRLDGLDGSGLGTLAAEGDQTGRAEFRIDFPRPVAGFTLTSSPRLFGDRENPSFALASWSTDGSTFHPLYRVVGSADGKWEDVYGRRLETAVETAPASRLWLRFELRQAQLCSLGNHPNQPMTLHVAPAEPFPGPPPRARPCCCPPASRPGRPGLGRSASGPGCFRPGDRCGPTWGRASPGRTAWCPSTWTGTAAWPGLPCRPDHPSPPWPAT